MKQSLAVLASLLILTACGGGESESSTGADPAPSATSEVSEAAAGGPGTYYTESGSTYLALDFTGETYSGDKLLDETRAIAEATDSSFPAVVRVSVDNSSGGEEWSSSDLRVVTGDGRTLTGVPARDVAGIPIEQMSDDDSIYNRSVEASNAWGERDSVLPGAKATIYYFFDEKLDDVARVYLDGVEAFKR